MHSSADTRIACTPACSGRYCCSQRRLSPRARRTHRSTEFWSCRRTAPKRTCVHPLLATLDQAVRGASVGNADQASPVALPVGAVLGVYLGPAGQRGHAEPTGVAVSVLPSEGYSVILIVVSEHAAAEDTDALEGVPISYDRRHATTGLALIRLLRPIPQTNGTTRPRWARTRRTGAGGRRCAAVNESTRTPKRTFPKLTSHRMPNAQFGRHAHRMHAPLLRAVLLLAAETLAASPADASFYRVLELPPDCSQKDVRRNVQQSTCGMRHAACKLRSFDARSRTASTHAPDNVYPLYPLQRLRVPAPCADRDQRQHGATPCMPLQQRCNGLQRGIEGPSVRD